MPISRLKRIVYTKNLAEHYDEDRCKRLGDILFWKKEEHELHAALSVLDLNIQNILEAGCGTGRFLEKNKNAKWVMYGLDISPYMLKIAKKKMGALNNECHLIQADISHIPFNNFHPDFVYSIRVINQLPSKEYALKAIAELIRICNHPGAILIEYINAWSISRFSKPSTLLTIRDVKRIVYKHKECEIIYLHGILTFSQSIWNLAPPSLLPHIEKLDSIISKFIPFFATRCYVLIKKGSLT